MKPLKLSWRIGTAKSLKLSRQPFTKSVIRHREYHFPPFLCLWIVVVSGPSKHAPAPFLTTVVFGLSHYYFAMLMMLVHDPRMPKIGTQYLQHQKEMRVSLAVSWL
jgi:hypothetical protein